LLWNLSPVSQLNFSMNFEIMSMMLAAVRESKVILDVVAHVFYFVESLLLIDLSSSEKFVPFF
jgi:type IV secretory pathway VirB3-like protein